jgi:hypothetical protein
MRILVPKRHGPFLMALCAGLAALLAAAQHAAAQGPAEAAPSGREIVTYYNTGARFTLAPGVFIPLEGERVGFSLAGDFRYGFDTGPLIAAPGARVAAFFLPDARVVLGLATARVTVPVGPVGPFVLGGVGPGFVSAPEHVDLGYLAGGGFMVHFGVHVAVGAEVAYQAIRRTSFSALSVGPSLLLAF